MNEVIYTDGTRDRIPGKLSLSEMQGKVGGLIEMVHLPDGQYLVVNEEGLIDGLPINETASMLAKRTIVGTAILTSNIE